jgi:hypothetical protein
VNKALIGSFGFEAKLVKTVGPVRTAISSAAVKPTIVVQLRSPTRGFPNREGDVMRFLLKAAFWLSIVLFLIPMPKSETPTGSIAPERSVSAAEALGAAQVAIHDLQGFCQRNPAACEVGTAALITVGEKAKVGAKMVYEYLDTKLPSDKPAQPAASMAPPAVIDAPVRRDVAQRTPIQP